MRRVIIIVIAILAVTFLIFSFTELQDILDVLKNSNLYYLFGAICFEAVCLYNTAATFGALYRLVGLKENNRQLFLMAAAGNFVNVIAPSGGLGGIAVFLDNARKRKIAAGRVMVVGALYLVYEYASLLCLLAFGFIVLIRRNNLNAGEVFAASLLLFLALAVGMMLFISYRSSKRLGDLLAWMVRMINRILKPFLHRDYLKVRDSYHFAREMHEGLAMIRSSSRNLIWPILFTLNNKALQLCVLAMVFLALNTPFTVGTLVGGFSISSLFFYISPTPSGVGFVEGILPAALNTLRVPFTEAVLITMGFRGVTLWLPLAVGAVAFRMLHRQDGTPSQEVGSSGE